ncbi:TIGR02452 family protein [Streptomyces sp. R302]|uniref:TIGR02452 family protein n=1 Tax=unclassified Streptomyces TaxID=2593676 RepID=UPI00145E99C2|nr:MULTISPECIES: TIGR02452 family protein [unclassified Streptomyces]NML50744.1 TIGR02452 family protein [Streptomyces sp. R301]NML80839.1 TIGR02452 family protein [Streptomyces sp. R302]
MSARLREIARQTEAIVAAASYAAPDGRTVSLHENLSAALAGTRLYGPEPVPVTPAAGRAGRIEVTGESSLAAARRMTAADPAGPVAVLNFASARNPGGGYLNGAQAQEEALCRSSALHATLLRAPAYYEHHRSERDALYTDRVIHSPRVPVFRDDRGALLATPFTVGFLTSPAPNAGVVRRQDPARAHLLPAVLASRAERVLETAVAEGYHRIVLGAWGCGVFRNDPAEVAGAFKALLTGDGRFAGHFDEVVFAVLDRASGTPTLAAFHRILDPVARSAP